MLRLIIAFLLFSVISYAQTPELDKLKEYSQMLKDSLITQAEYNILKERLLFDKPDTVKVTSQQPIIINTRKQVTNEEYLKLEKSYDKSHAGGVACIVVSILLDAVSVGTLAGALKGHKEAKAMAIISGISGIIGLPLFIAGIVKVAKANNRSRKLETDYQIIAEK